MIIHMSYFEMQECGISMVDELNLNEVSKMSSTVTKLLLNNRTNQKLLIKSYQFFLFFFCKLVNFVFKIFFLLI